MNNSTTRFSNRVDDYVKYRPSNPIEVLELLRSECSVTQDSAVADIGSGTGILSSLLLQYKCPVLGVEPNREMREAAEQLLGSNPLFNSLAATAEETKLEAGSVDLIAAGQAFHWFDVPKSKSEFLRILKPNGWVAIIWNERQTESTQFLKDYETLLKDHATDYETVNHMNIGNKVIGEFFSPSSFQTRSFYNAQRFDFEGLKGRCLSCSYIPDETAQGYDVMISELNRIFEKNQEDGIVSFEYQTKIHWGQLAV